MGNLEETIAHCIAHCPSGACSPYGIKDLKMGNLEKAEPI